MVDDLYMKKFLLLLVLVGWLPLWAEDETEPVDYGTMFNWETYSSYYNASDVVKTSTAVYCLAGGSLFSLDIKTREITRWNKQNGLNGGKISSIHYVPDLDNMLIVYADNMLDMIDKHGNINPIRDLYQTTSKAINIHCTYIHKQLAYLGTDFGIIAINLKKREVADTYYMGAEAQDVVITNIAVANDTLFALSNYLLYKASLQSNLLSYTVWETENLPLKKTNTWHQLTSYNKSLWSLQDTTLMVRHEGKWDTIPSAEQWNKLFTDGEKLYAINQEYHIFEISPTEDTLTPLYLLSNVASACYDGHNHVYWLGLNSHGICELNEEKHTVQKEYLPDGPFRNDIYSLTFAGEKLFICPGYRWADRGYVDASFAYRNEDETWGYESYWHTASVLKRTVRDLVSVAVDPNDNKHFFMCSYGDGVIEYRNNVAYKQYTEGTDGCTLQTLVENNLDYVRTDGAMTDNLGYLWVMQPETRPNTIHLMNITTGKWKSFNLYSGGQRISFNTPKGIWMDQRYPQRKWMISQRNGAHITLLDDGGTPENTNDDRCVARTSLTDQNNNSVSFTYIYDWAQDRNNDIWVGLEGGLVIIPSNVDFMTSNQCKRVIIPRNDGTGLADYLLANDNVRAIAVDGGNRKWLGTESSGVYLVSPDGITTIHHFTAENSPLPSNNITDIAIHPTSEEVFIGTSAGLVSFRSDAATPLEEYNLIAYPNPVRPNYDGVVTIKGLTEGSVVNIIDQGGQLVCKTNANGGIAVWDLKNGDGRRVSSGIYTALCNDIDGKHGLVKIMVMNR